MVSRSMMRPRPAVRLAVLIVLLLTLGAPALHAQSSSFKNPPMLVTAEDPQALISGDWNGDGHQDLIYISGTPHAILHVLLGNGKGGFQEGATVELPTGSCNPFAVPAGCWLKSGDFNGDGKMDLLLPGAVAYQRQLIVLPGNGDGTFGTPVVSSFSSPNGDTFSPYGVAVADFNNDGVPDVAAPSEYDETASVYLGDGHGGFTLGTVLRISYNPYAVYADDVNHDGKQDMVIFSNPGYGTNGNIWVCLGDGTGNFASPVHYPSSYSILFYPLGFLDMNGDGLRDVLGVDNQQDVQVMTGNADGTFNPPQTIFTGVPYVYSIYTADVNGDSTPDLVYSDTQGIDIVTSKGSLSYNTKQMLTSGVVTGMVASDFNEDGVLDLAARISGGIQFFYGNKTGTFPDSSVNPVSDPVMFLYAADFNGDGIADVAALDGNGIPETFLGVKGGGFSAPVHSATALNFNYTYVGNTVGDFDGDGKQDIFIPAAFGTSIGEVLYGNGDGTFTPVSGSTLNNGVVADLNHDGKSDFVGIADYGTNGYNYGLVALLGNSQRGFTTVFTGFPNLGGNGNIVVPALLGVRDMNGDGFPDAIIYNPAVPALQVWLGNGDGTFRAGSSTSLIGYGLTPADIGGYSGFSADFDLDGHNDIAFLATQTPASNEAAIAVLVIAYGDGTGTLSAPQIIPLSHAYQTVVPAVLDSGKGPGFVLGTGSLIGIIHNLGARQYSSEQFVTAGSFTSLLAADFSGDGFSDIAVNRLNPSFYPYRALPEFTVLHNFSPGSTAGLLDGTLAVLPAIVDYNGSFTLTATLTPVQAGAPSPTGEIDFTVAGVAVGRAALQNGQAVLQVPGSITQTLPAGNNSVLGQYSGDGNYGFSAISGGIEVREPNYDTQTSLAVLAGGLPVNTIQASNFVKLTATVTALQPVTHGYVSFYDGTTVLGQTTISAGSASLSLNTLSIGSHSITAQYQGYSPVGAAVYQASISPAATLTVTGIPTATTLSSSASSVTAGAVLTLTATVIGATGSPNGGVTFFDGTTVLETLPLDANGSAVLSVASLNTGAHSLAAQYNANGIFYGSSSQPTPVTVKAAASNLQATTVAISQVSPLSRGAGAQLNIAVRSQSGANVEGQVYLLVDGQLMASGTLQTDGTVSLSLQLADAAVHQIRAAYSGSTHTAPSVSESFSTTLYRVGDDFVLQAGTALRGGSVLELPLTIAAAGRWNSSTTLTCAVSDTSDYECSIAPSTVQGPGRAVLTLRQKTVASNRLLLHLAMLLPCAVLFKLRKRIRPAILLTAFTVVMWNGCGNTSAKTSPLVVTVQASSGAIYHAIQVVTAVPQ
jgi:hypothetical protein